MERVKNSLNRHSIKSRIETDFEIVSVERDEASKQTFH